MTDSTDKIIIDLTKDLLPHQIDDTNLIHSSEKNKLRTSIDDYVKENNKSPESENSNNTLDDLRLLDIRHNKFLIDGTRGSGKTTFTRLLIKDLLKDTGKTLLAWVDPTMIETREHIFFSLIQSLKTKVEKKIEGSNDWDNPSKDYEQWRNQLKRLAGGLSLLQRDKDEDKLKHYDALINLDRGTSKAQSGSDLAKDFYELLEISAKILGNDYFIIAFDDADMNSQYGWEILELIRKYLNSPKIITIIAGDLELYTSIVKYNLSKQQNKHIEDQKLEVSAEEYILKLFPSKNRIKLSGLQSLSTNTNPDVNKKIWLKLNEE
jgi:hypothetical protein